MKKIILSLLLLLAFAVEAQDQYYTNYSFVVEPQNEAAVYKLVDDYYSENKPEGVFVRLFENHFKSPKSKATHMIVFLDLRKMWETCMPAEMINLVCSLLD